MSVQGMNAVDGKLVFNGNELAPNLYDPKNFTHAAYREQIQYALNEGYSFVGFDDAETAKESGSKTIVLRHDEPFSLEASLEIAKINSELGIQGTFFIDADSAFYDLEDNEIAGIVAEIQSLGQSIALKVYLRDENLNVLPVEDIEEKVALDKQAFFDATGVVPTVYAPDATGLKNDGLDPETIGDLVGMVSAYGHIFADGVKREYHSNSNGMCLYGSSLTDLIDREYSHIHECCHPCWLSQEAKLPYQRLQQLPVFEESPELFRDYLANVHSSGRVVAGDGNKPKVDLVVETVMNARSEPKSGNPVAEFPEHDPQ